MDHESLEIAIDLIFKSLDKSDINVFDKIELLKNIQNFLKVEYYDENIRILDRENYKRRFKK